MSAKNRGKCNKNKGDSKDMINMNNGNTLNAVFRKLLGKHLLSSTFWYSCRNLSRNVTKNRMHHT